MKRIDIKLVKQYTHCGETYKLKKKIAQFDMEDGIKHHIFLSNKKYKGIPLCLMFVERNWGARDVILSKITDAYTFWTYWTEFDRQAWIVKRDDSELWKETRRDIEAYQKKKKNKDILPPICWD